MSAMDLDLAPGQEAEQKESKLYAIIGRRDYRIEELQEENAALRARLDSLLKQQQIIINAQQTPLLQAAAPHETSPTKPFQCGYDDLDRRYAELDWRFKSLEALHRGCETKISNLDAKCKDYKARARGWYEYIERQRRHGKITRPGSSGSSKSGERRSPRREESGFDVDTTPRASVQRSLALPVREVRRTEQRSSKSPTIPSSPLPMQSFVQVEPPEPTCIPHLRVSSSQTTVEEALPIADGQEKIADSSDDEPELISERCLKRKAPRVESMANRGQGMESTANTASPVTTGVLQPISVNVPRVKQISNKSTPRRGHAGPRAKVGILSEDGDDSSQVNAPPKDAEVPSLRKDATLDGLLMGHSTESTPDVARPNIRSACNAQRRTPAQLRTPISAIKPTSPSKRPTAAALPHGIEAPPAPFQPEDEPLRLRDVRQLKLEDFKVNPNYLGSEFAFADTLRGRDDRRALHTCTKSDCCGGALQKAILMGGQKVSGKTDAEALGEYLGPQYQQLMASYGTTKQKDTVLQAHAAAFAKQHGKHRQAFERQSTPPGFWRTDFPTTQENLEDRQKARENERLLVEARYREAMMDGGQWIFRDE
ncbi:Putative DNA endonuclease activator Ctp1 [Septoria linicola]|uniref:DNA endonuclease activator Ctp1 n=1 Tax=Septoria linicola TaxID=215465 RepID=A0A9Q9EHQ1_9PEZI|nr:Putative DNA endonuclease activator Ctp1 [Septoria linicola]